MILSSSWRLFLLLCALPVITSWSALTTTLASSRQDDAYTHILLILPVTVILLVAEKPWRGLTPRMSVAAGGAMLGGALTIGVFARVFGNQNLLIPDVRVSLEMLAVVLWWIGAFVLCFSTRLFRACAFPLLFLLWLVPIPAVLLNHVVYFLQVGSAAVARVLLTVSGLSVRQNGTVLAVPGLTVEIAKECSSIRSSLMLVVTATVMAHLFLRTLGGKAVVSMVAIPLALVKNGLRVSTLVALAVYLNPAILNGRLHHQGGIIFFVLAIILLAVLLWFVSRIEGQICKGVKWKRTPVVVIRRERDT